MREILYNVNGSGMWKAFLNRGYQEGQEREACERRREAGSAQGADERRDGFHGRVVWRGIGG